MRLLRVKKATERAPQSTALRMALLMPPAAEAWKPTRCEEAAGGADLAEEEEEEEDMRRRARRGSRWESSFGTVEDRRC